MNVLLKIENDYEMGFITPHEFLCQLSCALERYGVEGDLNVAINKRLASLANSIMQDLLSGRVFSRLHAMTYIAVAFHQRGIQIGFGPNVMICHNQCMLSPELYMSSYSEKGKRGSGMEIPTMLDTLKSWLVDARHLIETDRERIARMKETKISVDQMFLLIGLMTAARVAADTTRKTIRRNVTYPLSQSQITVFTEDMLEAYASMEYVTAWDMYNSATNLYKANRMDIPSLLPQNRARVEFMRENNLII